MADLFRIEINDESLVKAINSMSAAGKAFPQVMRRTKNRLKRELGSFAAKQTGPQGSWPKRSSGGEKRAARRRAEVKRGRTRKAGKRVGARSSVSFSGGKKLLGKLPDTVAFKANSTSVVARSPIPWSGVHNEGGKVGRGSTLPARPFVFIPESVLEKLAKEMLEKVIGAAR